ncbi:MAG: SEC59/DGK1/VTE5 family protein [Chlorobiales bacterium]|jgi:dolichol kinase|nr:SEC59/DGK1/VTE5 family protein [Chlorobiales bacterium]
MEQIDRLELRHEVARKTIHLSSISIPVIYYFISRDIALLLLIPLFAGFFSVDLLKNFSGPFSTWYHNTFDAMLRTHELEKKPYLNGATYITMGALFLVLFFPKVIAVTAFSMVAVSDTFAALIGKAFGKHRFGQKSLEGSVAFFLCSLIIVTVVPGLNGFIGFFMAIVATATEAFFVRIGNFKIDDNLSIPIITASAGMLCYMLFMPEQIPLLSICR